MQRSLGMSAWSHHSFHNDSGGSHATKFLATRGRIVPIYVIYPLDPEKTPWRLLKVLNPPKYGPTKKQNQWRWWVFSWHQLHLFGWSWWSLQVATVSLLFPDNEGRKRMWHKVILGLKIPFLMRDTQINRYRLICKSDSWQWLKLPFDHHLLWLC